MTRSKLRNSEVKFMWWWWVCGWVGVVGGMILSIMIRRRRKPNIIFSFHWLLKESKHYNPRPLCCPATSCSEWRCQHSGLSSLSPHHPSSSSCPRTPGSDSRSSELSCWLTPALSASVLARLASHISRPPGLCSSAVPPSVLGWTDWTAGGGCWVLGLFPPSPQAVEAASCPASSCWSLRPLWGGETRRNSRDLKVEMKRKTGVRLAVSPGR